MGRVKGTKVLVRHQRAAGGKSCLSPKAEGAQEGKSVAGAVEERWAGLARAQTEPWREGMGKITQPLLLPSYLLNPM